MAGLYESIRSGFTLTLGTDVDVNLPSGVELDDYRWVSFIAGDDKRRDCRNVGGSGWEYSIPIPAGWATALRC